MALNFAESEDRPFQYRHPWGGPIWLTEEENHFVKNWYKKATDYTGRQFDYSHIEIQWILDSTPIYYPTVYFLSIEENWNIALKVLAFSESPMDKIRHTAFSRLLGPANRQLIPRSIFSRLITKFRKTIHDRIK